jgi:hypothetical protein
MLCPENSWSNLIQDVWTNCEGMDGVVSFGYWAVGFLFMAVLPFHRGRAITYSLEYTYTSGVDDPLTTQN